MSWFDQLLEAMEPAVGSERAPDELLTVPDGTVLVPGVLVLDEARVSTVSSPGEPLSVELIAVASISGERGTDIASMSLYLHLPSLYYVLNAATGADSQILQALVDCLGLTALDLDELSITHMRLSGSLRTGAFRVEVLFAGGEDWSSGPLTMSGLSVDFGTRGGAGGVFATMAASGQLAARGGHQAIADLVVTASVAAGGGWALAAEISNVSPLDLLEQLGWDVSDVDDPPSGSIVMTHDSATGASEISISLDLGQRTALGDVVEQIVGVVGGSGAAIPEFLDHVAIDDADLAFHRNGQDVVLTGRCRGRLGFDLDNPDAAVPQLEATPAIVVDVRVHRHEGRIDVTFSGTLTIGERDTVDLALVFETSSTGSMVVGSFRPADGGVPVDLAELAPPTLGLPSVAVNVGQVVFVWDRDDDGVSRYLLSCSIAAESLNAELPLVGKLFPDPGLTMEVAVTAATAEFDDLAAVNAILLGQPRPLTPLPDTVARGLNVASVVDFGGSAIPLAFIPGNDGTTNTNGSGDASNGEPSRPVRDDGTTASADTKWVSVQRSFGPVHVSRVGLGYADETVTLRLDASVTLAGLTISLNGLAASSRLDPFELDLHLAGLGIDVRTNDVTVSGTFLWSEDTSSFIGSAIIQTTSFTMQAFGAFEQVAGDVSLFVFAALNKAFGGPAAFFVTGIAAGFGYNRDFLPPALEQVDDHPFLTALDPGARQRPAGEVLVELGHSVPARVGASWLAGGLTFESFKMIRSSAVVLVRLGNEVEVLLLGRSVLTLPRGAAHPHAKLELALRASVKPTAGTMLVEGRLTDKSYVIDPTAVIRGGFAFALWFGDSPHSGDFVLTAGGYHPSFRPPEHYPRPERLEFSWVNGAVTIGGWAYFALTPSCVMAGGQLEASYRDGGVFASFTMSAHFLIRWKPFAYDAMIGVSIYASLTVDTIAGPVMVDTRLSASVHVWGPEFAGVATIEWGVISFDVEFGAIETDRAAAVPLSWAEFREAYLPGDDADACSIRITSGLVDREALVGAPVVGDATTWIVNGDALTLATSSLLPSSQLCLRRGAEQVVNLRPEREDASLVLRPMGGLEATSVHTITLRRLTTQGDWVIVDLGSDVWARGDVVRQNVPKELWYFGAGESALSADASIRRPVGLRGLRPHARVGADNPPALRLTDLPPAPVRPGVSSTSSGEEAQPSDLGVTDREVVFAQIEAELSENATRAAVIEDIRAHGFLGAADSVADAPVVLAAHATELLSAAPMLGDGTLGGPTTRHANPVPAPVSRPDLSPFAALVVAIKLLVERSDQSGHEIAGSSLGPTYLELRSDEGVVEPGAAQTLERTVADGTTAVFELERRETLDGAPTSSAGPAVHLEIDAHPDLATRLVVLDRFGTPLSVSESSAVLNQTIAPALDDRAAIVAVTVRSLSASAFGWHGTSSLLKVGPRTYLVDGGTLTTEVEQAGGTGSRRGVAVVRDNVLPTADRVAGWVRTHLPSEVRAFAVYVRRAPMGSARGPTSPIEVIFADGSRRRLFARSVVHDGPSEVAMLFEAPAEVREQATSPLVVEVQVTGERGWALNGVVGWRSDVASVRRDWVPGRRDLATVPSAADAATTIRVVGQAAA